MKKVLCTLIEYSCIIANLLLSRKMQLVQTSQFAKINFVQYAQEAPWRKKNGRQIRSATKKGGKMKKSFCTHSSGTFIL